MKNLIKKTLREHTLTNVDEFKDEIFELPLEQRKSVLRGLETLASVKNQENLEEQIKYGGIPEMKASSTLGKILKWFKRYITDKATNYLINASMNEIKDAIHMLKVLDPTDMSGIFTPKAMYLGGGIDFAEDGASWRTKVEEFFGPEYVVKDERLKLLVTTGNLNYSGLKTPAILNPLRAETVRAEDPEFQEMFGKWKANEAQISALKNQQVFIWLNKGLKMSNISPWLFPSITKILKDDELWPFLENFK